MENLISNHWNIVRNRFYDPENPLKEVSFMILAILVLSYVPFKNQNFWNFGQKLQLKISFRALAHVFLLTFWTHVQKPLDYLQSAQLGIFVRLQPVLLYLRTRFIYFIWNKTSWFTLHVRHNYLLTHTHELLLTYYKFIVQGKHTYSVKYTDESH